MASATQEALTLNDELLSRDDGSELRKDGHSEERSSKPKMGAESQTADIRVSSDDTTELQREGAAAGKQQGGTVSSAKETNEVDSVAKSRSAAGAEKKSRSSLGESVCGDEKASQKDESERRKEVRGASSC